MRKFAFVLSGLAALAITLFVSSTSAIEEPTYSLVAQWDDPDVEIRDYDARILATTQMNEGQNSGFRVLAGYIFGGNEREQEIAMTAPVQRTMPGKKDAEMAFVVPREYSMGNCQRLMTLVFNLGKSQLTALLSSDSAVGSMTKKPSVTGRPSSRF